MMTALPESEERDHFGSLSFRVNGKIFAQLSACDQTEQRALVKLSLADQAALTMSHPDAFAPAPQWGRHGWTYIQLAAIDERMFRDVVLGSWRKIAPKKLVAAHAEMR
jgi:hypothetical protein